MEKHQLKEINATLKEKKSSDYFAIPGRVPTPTDVYEVIFEAENKNLYLFEVSGLNTMY